MKEDFEKSLSDFSRRGLCFLLSLLLMMTQVPMTPASTLSKKELSSTMGAGISQDIIQAPEAPVEEQQSLVADTPPSSADSMAVDAGVPAEAQIPPDVPAEEKQPLAESVVLSEPPAPLPSDEAKEAGEVTRLNADGMVLQSTAYSCGPAALATLLKMRGGKNYYDQIMQKVTLDEQGSSLLALKQAAAALGYQTQGYRLALADLTGAELLLAHVIFDGKHHFTVILRVYGQSVYLADPTLGRIAMPLEVFAQAFSGAVLKVRDAETTLPQIPPQIETAPKEETTSGAADIALPGGEVVPEAKASEAPPAAESTVTEAPVEQCVATATQAATQLAAEFLADAPAVDAASVSKLPANQFVQLDVAEMEQVRGRFLPLAGVAFKVAVKAIKAMPTLSRAAMAGLRTHRHHIVALRHRKAAGVRDQLERWGIDLNNRANIVELKGPFHQRLHRGEYFDALEDALRKARSREHAIRILRRSGEVLKREWNRALRQYR